MRGVRLNHTEKLQAIKEAKTKAAELDDNLLVHYGLSLHKLFFYFKKQVSTVLILRDLLDCDPNKCGFYTNMLSKHNSRQRRPLPLWRTVFNHSKTIYHGWKGKNVTELRTLRNSLNTHLHPLTGPQCEAQPLLTHGCTNSRSIDMQMLTSSYAVLPVSVQNPPKVTGFFFILAVSFM